MAPSKRKRSREAGIDAEAKLLPPILGSLSTHDQIVEASHMLSTLNLPRRKDHTKWSAVEAYIEGQVHRDWIWVEIEIYRMIGQTSAFLLDGPQIDMDRTQDSESVKNFQRRSALHDLETAVQTWSYLALEGALGHLLMHDNVNEVKRRNGSAAELFRAFLRAEQVEVWDDQEMYRVFRYIYKFAEDFRRIKRESQAPSADVLNLSDQVASPDVSSAAVRQQTSSRRSQDSASHSLNHGLPVPDTAGTKRIRLSPVENPKAVTSIIRPESAENTGLNSDEDIYDASPPPGRVSHSRGPSLSSHRTSIMAIATSNDLDTDSVRDTPAVQAQVSGASEDPSDVSINGSQLPEDLFLAKFSTMTKDLKTARVDLENANQSFSATTREKQHAVQQYTKGLFVAEIHWQKHKTSCLRLGEGEVDSNWIRVVAGGWRELGSSEEERLLKCLEPFIANENATRDRNDAKERVSRLEKKLNPLFKVFDED